MTHEWLLWSNSSQFLFQQSEQIFRGAVNDRSILYRRWLRKISESRLTLNRSPQYLTGKNIILPKLVEIFQVRSRLLELQAILSSEGNRIQLGFADNRQK